MNFLKSFFNKKDDQPALPEYIKNFKIYGNLYRREEKTSKLLMEESLISFSEGKTKFNYFLEFTKDEENFYFPISTTMDLREQTVQDGDALQRKYVFDLEEKLRMRIEFDVTDQKDLDEVLKFERYFCELLCITFLQKHITPENEERIGTMCRHVVGKDLGRESETTSQRDSDVFSIAQASQKGNTGSDMNRLTRDLAGLKIDEGKRVGKYQHHIKLYQKTKEQEALERKQEEEKLREDITIENRNNKKLQDALLSIIQLKEISLSQVGCMYKAIGDEMVLEYTGIIFAIKILEDYDYKMLIFNDDQHVIHQYHFEDGQQYEINNSENYIRWIEIKGDNQTLYQVSFDLQNASKDISFILQKCNYEKVNQTQQNKNFKEEEIQEIIRFSTHPLEDDYLEENKDYMEEEMLDYTFNPDVYMAQGESQSDSQLRTITQAKVLDRTFVSRGENIEVFRTQNDNENTLQYLLSLPIVQGLNGEVFEPKKMLMQEQDTKMLLLNNEENKKVFNYDIEKGKIIQEFSADQYYLNGIKDICNQSKNGDLDHNQTFYSINSKNIFLMDPRIAKGQAQSCISKEEKLYKSNNHFTCISSTQNGEFAIGSNDGSIRLFNEVTKKAKNQFNLGYGDSIKGLDISKDGKWILATCQTYLILFPTYDQSNSSKNGFTSTIKINERSTPIRLQLSSEDQYYLKLKEIGFTPAKFDNCLDKKEKFIVSSTGVYTIVWDFQKVLQKKTQSYEIKKSEEQIKYAEFKFNMNENVLAASTSKLVMQNMIKKKHQY